MAIYRKAPRIPTNKAVLLRPRINKLLEKGIKYPELVVSAGAGSGKTQAVVSFLEYSSHRGVWLQLTLLDNLPSRFWISYTNTVALHRKDLSEKLKELGFPDTLSKIDRFLHLVTKELYTDNQFVIIVFDDFHLIYDKSVLQFIRRFASANLENICIVRITRQIELPSFDNTLFMIQSDDLLFTKEECAQYLKLQNLPYLSDTDVSNIYAYSGGWPMALYLLGLQMKNRDLHWEERLVHSQQIIFQLIETEIFTQYNTREREFFILLSILNFFPRDLLRIFTEDDPLDIDTLMKNNVLVLFDPKANHYYLHQIFLDFLILQQTSIKNDVRENILFKAANWCSENGFNADAIDYFFRCGKYNQVWKVIEDLECVRLPKDEATYFITYIEKMPVDLMVEKPMRRIIYAMLLLNNMELDQANQQINNVFKQLKSDPRFIEDESKTLLGETYAAAGLISFGLENLDFVTCFMNASDCLPNGSGWLKPNLRLVEYTNALNIVSAKKGALEKSLEAFRLGMPYVSKVLNGAGYGLEYLASAEASFLTGDIAQAQKDAYQAIYMSQEKQQYDIIDNAFLLLLRIYMVSGNTNGIQEIYKKLEYAKSFGSFNARTVADIAFGWFYSEIGLLSNVAGWIRFDSDENQPPISMDKEILVRIRCLLAERKYYEALAVLDWLEQLYFKKNTLISLLYSYVYRAITLYKSNDKSASLKVLTDAYLLAYENNLIMPFIEFGHQTRSLLEYAYNHIDSATIPEKWLRTVKTKAATCAKRHAFIAAKFKNIFGDTAVEYDLSDREQELLHNLSQGLTREEIADSMFISVHTVKSMLKTVYNKIDAINSADAIRIATTIGLL